MPWPTPTPFPTGTPVVDLPIDPAEMMHEFSNNIIQGWNIFDSSPIATLVFIGLLMLIVFLGLMSIRSHLENL
jgi:hypothetical protein